MIKVGSLLIFGAFSGPTLNHALCDFCGGTIFVWIGLNYFCVVLSSNLHCLSFEVIHNFQQRITFFMKTYFLGSRRILCSSYCGIP